MRYLSLPPLILLLILMCGPLCADTILLKDGQELKGVVVEDYHDRVVFSTEKGEVGLSKKSIEKISYETQEENLVKLGDFYRDKGDYKLALYYYEAAYKLNPDMKEAQQGTLLATNMIFCKRESDLEKEVALKQDTEENLGRPLKDETFESKPLEAKIHELWEKVGISIENVGPDMKVSKVLKKSPADKAGIEEQDVIVSVWGKLIKYMQPNDVYDLLLHSEVSELRITVSRNKSILLKKNHVFDPAERKIGGRLSMEFEGLTVIKVDSAGPLENAGVLEGDRITRLADSSTRYMPLEVAYKLIETTKNNTLSLDIQREVVLWKR